MTNCSVGPRYCPKCGKELAPYVSVCIQCRYNIKKR
ncbi:MAG: zinc-ribbon domain-containing protein [Candidatus Lokiarchaeota archaeon]|nr:zinc-ribbon domain-containing protein [Candidatus Lokiarchaeota archaeon]